MIKNRNQQAFAYLYDNYSRAIFGIINNIVTCTEEAEDVLQNTFVKIWNNFESYDSTKGRLYTWMINIARNMAIDCTRSKHEKNKSKIQDSIDDVYVINNTYADTNGTDAIGLKAVVDSLKDDYKLMIQLAYYKGYTQDEISKELNIPLGTVKTRVRNALLKLRELSKEKIQA
ncbi:MAG: sigma-70 family RNA polymerase sigma factor [Bacteroidia bacterium]|nr:sigma-70 family RNA polymerase sigma factor [Bacteroidia bacterium]